MSSMLLTRGVGLRGSTKFVSELAGARHLPGLHCGTDQLWRRRRVEGESGCSRGLHYLGREGPAGSVRAGGAVEKSVLGKAGKRTRAQQSRSFFSPLNPFADDAEPEAKKHLERRLVNFSPEQVYSVVVNVDEYNEFVPWCTSSKIISRTGKQFYAELSVGFKMLSESYTSLVTVEPEKFVKVQVKKFMDLETDDRTIIVNFCVSSYSNNLFRFLVNEWLFEKGPREGTTWLDFVIAYQFKNPMYQGLSSIFFDQVATKMMAAFERRCVTKFGKNQTTQIASEQTERIAHRSTITRDGVHETKFHDRKSTMVQRY